MSDMFLQPKNSEPIRGKRRKEHFMSKQEQVEWLDWAKKEIEEERLNTFFLSGAVLRVNGLEVCHDRIVFWDGLQYAVANLFTIERYYKINEGESEAHDVE